MANRIKGITVETYGDADKLSKALKVSTKHRKYAETSSCVIDELGTSTPAAIAFDISVSEGLSSVL